MAATISLFGKLPTSVILNTTDGFDKTAQTLVPVIRDWGVEYPAQTKGGRIEITGLQTVQIEQIMYKGTHDLEVYVGVVDPSNPSTFLYESLIASVQANKTLTQKFLVPKGHVLTFNCASGSPAAHSVTVVGRELRESV